ncbi:MAG: hypothetical protein AAGG02_16535 [Cyanobacteria bacterium P01_H01_bin.15]
MDCWLVPQGYEYRAVCRGIHPHYSQISPYILAVPAGPSALSAFLVQSSELLQSVECCLLLGLGGALQPELRLGQSVLCATYRDRKGTVWSCDHNLVDRVNGGFESPLPLVEGFSSEQVVCSSAGKKALGQAGWQVVDMEGAVFLDWANRRGISAAVVRVISDTWNQDLPDLTGVFDAGGRLNFRTLARRLIVRPKAAWDLIYSSQVGLAALEKIATCLAGQGLLPQEQSTVSKD